MKTPAIMTTTSSSLPAAAAASQNTNLEPPPQLVNPAEEQNGEDQQQQRRPQSPPLPQPHRPVTPGYRAERLQLLYSKSLDRVLSKLAYDNFSGCYPTMASKADAVLRQVQGQMVEKLKEKCQKEFENIMASRQVVPKLNDLERLVEQAEERRRMKKTGKDEDQEPTPPHLLPPSTIITAHLHPSLISHQSHLNARLQTTQSQNALLYADLQRQREEIDAMLTQLEAAVGDVNGANTALDGLIDELSKEAREAESDMTMARDV